MNETTPLKLSLVFAIGLLTAAQTQGASTRALGSALDQTASTAQQSDTAEDLARHYEALVDAHPDWAEGWYKLATIHLERSSGREAAEAFRRAISLKPDYAEAYNGLGWVSQLIYRCGNGGSVLTPPKNFETAIEAHQRALDLKPDYADAYRGLATAHFFLGHFQESADDYERGIRLDPSFNDGRYEAFKNISDLRLAKCYVELHRYDDAIWKYKELLSRTSNYKLQNDDRTLLAKKFDFWNACDGLAALYSKLSRFAEAIGVYNSLVEIEPDHWLAHYQLALTYISMRDKESALIEYDTLQDLSERRLDDLEDLEEPLRSVLEEGIKQLIRKDLKSLMQRIHDGK